VTTVLQVIAAAAPSKLPFYLAGAALAGWAVVLSFFGLRSASFPGGKSGAAGVIAVTGVLMAATLAMGIATATKPEKEAAGHEGGTAAGEPATPAETGQAPAAGALMVSADPGGQLRYQQKSLTAKAGRVTIDFTNQSPVPHDVTIERGGKKVGGTKPIANSKATATVALEPGSYTFYCSVDAHRQAGMQGTLSVR
jgi:plastocyanin